MERQYKLFAGQGQTSIKYLASLTNRTLRQRGAIYCRTGIQIQTEQMWRTQEDQDRPRDDAQDSSTTRALSLSVLKRLWLSSALARRNEIEVSDQNRRDQDRHNIKIPATTPLP